MSGSACESTNECGRKVSKMVKARELLAGRLAELSDVQLALVGEFIDQILRCEDPDVVRTFLSWRTDPRIDSILDLAATLGDEARDQLLFAAEDLYSESRPAHRLTTFPV